jgi:hypothetical protein
LSALCADNAARSRHCRAPSAALARNCVPTSAALRSKGCVILFRYVGDVFEVVNIIEGHRDIEALSK